MAILHDGIEMPNKPGFNRFWSFTNVSQLVFCAVKIIDHIWGLTVNGRLYFNFLSWVWFSDRFPYLARLQTSEGTHSTWRFVASSLTFKFNYIKVTLSKEKYNINSLIQQSIKIILINIFTFNSAVCSSRLTSVKFFFSSKFNRFLVPSWSIKGTSKGKKTYNIQNKVILSFFLRRFFFFFKKYLCVLNIFEIASPLSKCSLL